MGGYLGDRADTVKHYKKSEQKWKKELKSLKNQNKMLFRIAEKSGSHHEMKNIKKIRTKASNNKKNSGVGRLPIIKKTDNLFLVL